MAESVSETTQFVPPLNALIPVVNEPGKVILVPEALVIDYRC